MSKIILKILGSISLVLGIIGLFIPVLPTTPFLLLTATLWAKSSDKLYSWLMNHKVLGPYIKNFRENKVIPLRVKITTLCLLWVTMGISAYFVNLLWLRILLAVIGVCVTIHILSFKSE